MKPYIDAAFGWHDGAQELFFDEHFAPERCRIIQVNAHDIGVLIVDEAADEIWLELIEIYPSSQGGGIGTSVIRSLLQSGAETNRSVGLRVLRTNDSARVLYERLGFRADRETESRIYFRTDPPAT